MKCDICGEEFQGIQKVVLVSKLAERIERFACAKHFEKKEVSK